MYSSKHDKAPSVLLRLALLIIFPLCRLSLFDFLLEERSYVSLIRNKRKCSYRISSNMRRTLGY